MAATDAHAARPQVKVDGRLSSELEPMLDRVTIESQRHLPTMCVIEFADPYREVIDDATLSPGASVTVQAAPAEESTASLAPEDLFDGEVVAVEARMAHGASRVLVRAYDRGHRLHRVRHSRTWMNQSDGDIVGEIAGDHGLTADTAATPGTHDYLCQHLQTDWEFLTTRAGEIGYELALDGTKLGFRPVGSAPGAGPPTELELGDNLLRFRPRVTSAEQPDRTRFHGRDQVRAEDFSGTADASAENEPGEAAFAADRVASSFSGSREDAGRPVVADQAAADRWATGRRTHTMGVAFEADGECFGVPTLRAGSQVRVGGVGDRFSGTYTLSTVTHTFDQDGFRTQFSISGRHDRSLLGLANPGAGTAANGSRHPGSLSEVALATVTNTNDPDDLGRVKVKLPWLGDEIESTWAPVVAAGGGSGGGWQLQPEIGDQVLVAFEHGDVRRPYVLGGVWNEADPPVERDVVADGKTEKRCLTTRAGHRFLFDDTDRARRIELRTAGGVRFEMTDDDKATITLSDGDGDTNTIVIDGQERSVTVEAGGDLTLKAGGNLKLEAGANLDISAGAGLNAESNGPLKLKSSATAEFEGAASTTVKASGMLTVRGTPVKIN